MNDRISTLSFGVCKIPLDDPPCHLTTRANITTHQMPRLANQVCPISLIATSSLTVLSVSQYLCLHTLKTGPRAKVAIRTKGGLSEG